jgi:hypothetical protein
MTHRGEVKLNFGGSVVLTRPFTGTYEVRLHSPLALVVGDIQMIFSDEDPLARGQKNSLYFVMRDSEEVAFMLVGSDNPTAPPPNAGAAAVQGTLKRIQPLP